MFTFKQIGDIVEAAERRHPDEGRSHEITVQLRSLHKRGLVGVASRLPTGATAAILLNREEACLARLLISAQDVGIVGNALQRARNLLIRGSAPTAERWNLETAVKGIAAGEDWFLLARLPQPQGEGGFIYIQPDHAFSAFFEPVFKGRKYDRQLGHVAFSATGLLKPIIDAAK